MCSRSLPTMVLGVLVCTNANSRILISITTDVYRNRRGYVCRKSQQCDFSPVIVTPYCPPVHFFFLHFLYLMRAWKSHFTRRDNMRFVCTHTPRFALPVRACFYLNNSTRPLIHAALLSPASRFRYANACSRLCLGVYTRFF